MLSEERLVSLISWITSLVWPNGALFKPARQPTAAELHQAKEDARKSLLDSIPNGLNILLGKDNCTKGTMNFFHFCQMEPLLLHLVYTSLDAVLQTMFPELRKPVRLR